MMTGHLQHTRNSLARLLIEQGPQASVSEGGRGAVEAFSRAGRIGIQSHRKLRALTCVKRLRINKCEEGEDGNRARIKNGANSQSAHAPMTQITHI